MDRTLLAQKICGASKNCSASASMPMICLCGTYMSVDAEGSVEGDDGDPSQTIQDVGLGVLRGNVETSEPHKERKHHCKANTQVVVQQ